MHWIDSSTERSRSRLMSRILAPNARSKLSYAFVRRVLILSYRPPGQGRLPASGDLEFRFIEVPQRKPFSSPNTKWNGPPTRNFPGGVGVRWRDATVLEAGGRLTGVRAKSAACRRGEKNGPWAS